MVKITQSNINFAHKNKWEQNKQKKVLYENIATETPFLKKKL